MQTSPQHRFSGHETFPCRYAWLPKAYRELGEAPNLFSSDEDSMVRLGVGKNMVRAIRFWTVVAGIAIARPSGGLERTVFGKALLKRAGLDPYLEDRKTLWLLHWQISTQVTEPLFAWDYLLNCWPAPTFTRSEALAAFAVQSTKLGRKLSPVTLAQHFDTFLHTYFPTQGKKVEVQEDNLDCPLVELELISRVGERSIEVSGSREAIYMFNREKKEDITGELFVFCLADFWQKCRSHEQTLQLGDIANAAFSPGQILKLSEWDVRERLENISEDSDRLFEFEESNLFQRVVRRKKVNSVELLFPIYASERVDA